MNWLKKILNKKSEVPEGQLILGVRDENGICKTYRNGEEIGPGLLVFTQDEADRLLGILNPDKKPNRVFKVVSRDCKTGRQFKKRTYHSEEAFEKYGKDVIERYSRWYDVEAYEFIDGKWVELYKVKKGSDD